MLSPQFDDVDEIINIIEKLPNDYGDAIANLRTYKGHTQESLEYELSFGIKTLRRIESNLFIVPDINKIMEICIVLKLEYIVSLHLFKLCGLGDFLYLRSKQAIIYHKILTFEGTFQVDYINKLLVESGLNPLF